MSMQSQNIFDIERKIEEKKKDLLNLENMRQEEIGRIGYLPYLFLKYQIDDSRMEDAFGILDHLYSSNGENVNSVCARLVTVFPFNLSESLHLCRWWLSNKEV